MLPASSLGVALRGLSEDALSSESNAFVGLVRQSPIALFCSTSDSQGAANEAAAATARPASTATAARGTARFAVAAAPPPGAPRGRGGPRAGPGGAPRPGARPG